MVGLLASNLIHLYTGIVSKDWFSSLISGAASLYCVIQLVSILRMQKRKRIDVAMAADTEFLRDLQDLRTWNAVVAADTEFLRDLQDLHLRTWRREDKRYQVHNWIKEGF